MSSFHGFLQTDRASTSVEFIVEIIIGGVDLDGRARRYPQADFESRVGDRGLKLAEGEQLAQR